MVLNWQRVQGTQSDRPLDVDAVSSPSCVYVRKNIEQVEVTEESGDTHSAWEYDEAVLTPEEYERFQEIKDIVDAVQSDDTRQILNALLGGAA